MTTNKTVTVPLEIFMTTPELYRADLEMTPEQAEEIIRLNMTNQQVLEYYRQHRGNEYSVTYITAGEPEFSEVYAEDDLYDTDLLQDNLDDLREEQEQ